MTTNQLVKYVKLSALFLFFVGTAIFFSYYFTSNATLLSLGSIFLLVASFVSVIFLILILFYLKRNIENKKKLWKAAVILLLNIPIALLYIWMTFTLLQTMRVTLINNTSNIISNIKIIGCETINGLTIKPKKSKTIWVTIKNDCSIQTAYTVNKITTQATIIEYVTSGMGHKVTYTLK